jgi:hypothetical protein
MDIADFKRKCMSKDLSEIRGWMAHIHTAIDEPLERLLSGTRCARWRSDDRTRGNYVICVSGTSRKLRAHRGRRVEGPVRRPGTAVRMGIATAPVVLTHIAHGGDALPAKYIYGDTVSVARRMEQTGRRRAALRGGGAAVRGGAWRRAAAASTKAVKGRAGYMGEFPGLFGLSRTSLSKHSQDPVIIPDQHISFYRCFASKAPTRQILICTVATHRQLEASTKSSENPVVSLCVYPYSGPLMGHPKLVIIGP